MSGRKEANETARTYRQAGYDVKQAANGHYEVRKDGRLITTFAASPSSSRSVQEDRRKQDKILAGEELHDQRPEPVEEREVPAAFRSPSWHPSPRIPETLDSFNDVGDLFAEVTPVGQVPDRNRFAEAFSEKRRQKSERKLKRRLSKGDNKILTELRRSGIHDLYRRKSPCSICQAPDIDTAVGIMSSEYEGYMGFDVCLGMSVERAESVMRNWWNETFPYLPSVDEGEAAPSELIHGIPMAVIICRECWKSACKAYPVLTQLDFGKPGDIRFSVLPPGMDDGEEVWEQKCRVREALHRDLKAQWEEGQEE